MKFIIQSIERIILPGHQQLPKSVGATLLQLIALMYHPLETNHAPFQSLVINIDPNYLYFDPSDFALHVQD